MNWGQEKSQRLLQIEQLLWAHPEGLTRAEIARRLGVNRSTITKYLKAGQLPPASTRRMRVTAGSSWIVVRT